MKSRVHLVPGLLNSKVTSRDPAGPELLIWFQLCTNLYSNSNYLLPSLILRFGLIVREKLQKFEGRGIRELQYLLVPSLMHSQLVTPAHAAAACDRIDAIHKLFR